MITYPSIIASFSNPQATDRLNSPSHSAIEQAQNSNLTAIENFIGVDGAASTVGTLIYDLRSPASNGGGHVQAADKGGTGQTTFSQGDILVAQSASVIAKLSSAGNPAGYALVVDPTQAAGLKWGVPGNAPTIRVFSVLATTSILTYVKPSVLNYLRVKISGPGGSHGGGTIGGAGAGGAYAEKVIPASSIAAAIQLVVGGYNKISSVSGVTAFGSILTAGGGSVGNNDPGNGNTTDGVSGGIATGGDINVNGLASGSMSRSQTVPAPNAPGGQPLYLGFGRGESAVGGDSQYVAPTGGIIVIEEY